MSNSGKQKTGSGIIMHQSEPWIPPEGAFLPPPRAPRSSVPVQVPACKAGVGSGIVYTSTEEWIPPEDDEASLFVSSRLRPSPMDAEKEEEHKDNDKFDDEGSTAAGIHLDAQQPFNEMIIQNPNDYTDTHIRTGSGLRVVLDAANIGFASGERQHTISSTGESKAMFDINAVSMAIEYFTDLGIQVTAFLPANFLRKRQGETQMDKRENAKMITTEWERLDHYVSSKIITLVPAGCDDDLFVIHYARQHCCFVVSNDFYTDHIKRLREENDSKGASMKLWIDMNKSKFAFVHTAVAGAGASISFMLDPVSTLSKAIQAVHDSRFETASMKYTNEPECHTALAEHLSGAMSSVRQLTAYYTALLQQSANDQLQSTGIVDVRLSEEIWNRCNSLREFVEQQTSMINTTLLDTMTHAERLATSPSP